MGTEESGTDDKTEFISPLCFIWHLSSDLMKWLGGGREKREETQRGFVGADHDPVSTVRHQVTRQKTCYLRTVTVAHNKCLLNSLLTWGEIVP